MEIKQLFIKFLNNKCTVEEEQQVNELLEQAAMLDLLYTLIEGIDREAELTNDASTIDVTSKLSDWQKKISTRIARSVIDSFEEQDRHKNVFRHNLIRYAAVVMGFLFLATGSIFFLMSPRNQTDRVEIANEYQQLLPARDQATLTLANGEVVSLSQANEGEIAQQVGVQIEKTADGHLVYRVHNDAVSTTAYNTIATARGGQYQVILPDGSKAWLNAASSLSFPVQFKADERRVKMTGEVYFEIAKLDNKQGTARVPFFVETEKQTVEVLGTQFNINAYSDEPYTRTTLIEGSVRIAAFNSSKTVMLKPGQQAEYNNQFVVNEIAVHKIIAWKNGDFVFQEETLDNILRQIARWYDVDVECPTDLGNLRFNGMLSRAKPLSALINIIQSTEKVHIQIQGRRLIVKN